MSDNLPLLLHCLQSIAEVLDQGTEILMSSKDVECIEIVLYSLLIDKLLLVSVVLLHVGVDTHRHVHWHVLSCVEGVWILALIVVHYDRLDWLIQFGSKLRIIILIQMAKQPIAKIHSK